MERERYSVHQQAAEVVDQFSDRMQRAEALALDIGDAITASRDNLLKEDRMYGKTRLGYNLDMDSVIYQTLVSYRSADYLEHLVYWKAKQALDNFTHFQLETHLGERFNVLSSTYRLDIHNGEIWPEGGVEPFRNMLIRGQKYRKHHGSTELEREQAEIDGFVDNEPLLCDPRIPDGTIFLSFSPRGKAGSIYQHNSYDMFIRRTDKDRKPYLEARRYSSALTISEYAPKVLTLNPLYNVPDGIETDDIFWKKRIIRVTNMLYDTPEKVHAFLHKEHDYMSEKQFAFIKQGVLPYITAYIQILSENPYDTEMQDLAYRTILNRADELWRMLSGKSGGYAAYNVQAAFLPTMYDIRFIGSQKVRQVMTGCGVSGDQEKRDILDDPVAQMLEELFGSLFKTPYSVGEFGEDTDDLGQREFNCPVCNYKNRRPYNQTIDLCQNNKCPDRTKVAC